jgi:hypothetical protein
MRWVALSPLVAGLALLAAGQVSAATYYVSPRGDDGHTGLAPDDAQALRTVQAGVERLEPGDTLLIRAGIYRETVTFPRSGEAGRPLVLRPYGDGEVNLSGCEPVTGWTLHDAAKGIWKAPMPWTLGLGRNQVFTPDRVLIEARYPNVPDPGLGMYVSDLSPLWPTFGEFSIPKETAQAQPGRVVSKLLDGQPDDYWKGALYYGIHYEGWAAQTGVVESSKSGEINLTDRTRGWWFGAEFGGGYSPEEGRGMLVGHMHALDQPGEWFWQDNTLYLIPPDGGEPSGVEAKARQLAFDLSGREYIRVEGLLVKAASVRMQDSAWCTFDRCDLSYISHYTRHYGMGEVENGRDTLKSGETGIFVGGHDNAFLSCSVRFSAGAGFYLRGYHHTIHNCLIDQVSYTAHYLNAITDAVGDFPDYEHFLVGGHVITSNTMRNAGRHFFNFYGNGTSTASRDRGPMDYMATLFAHNHLYNGMLQTRDAGFITGYYSSGGTLDGLNSQVCYNVMHDSYDLAAMKWGVLGLVYLDAGSCDVDLHHNLLWAAPGSLQRGLWYNTMCVDVHEHDNLFHPEFTRTCAELTPADFPGGVPFRFGHDFANPPPVPAWPLLDKLRLPVQTPAEGLFDGSVLSLGEVDFDQGWQSVIMRFASDVQALNSDHSDRAAPRHRKATDPLALEATVNDGLSAGVATQWTFIYNVADGAWARFNQMPLGEGYRRFRVIYGNDQTTARTLEVHLDSADGPLVGTVSLPPTDISRGGRIQIYAQATGEIAPAATGTHDVFLVLHSPDGKPVGEFEYFRFEQYRGDMPQRPDGVRFELRVGSPQGEKVGELFPRCTGGADVWREMVASLEPARGRQPLFLAVRSAAQGPVGRVDWLSLERASQPGDVPGLGAPPLMQDGKLVLPEPTHRPCARPGDKYPLARAQSAAGSPRPIALATPLDQALAIDGRLADWPPEGARALGMGESYDGTPALAAHSRAWVAYDAEALYIAMRHPVANAAALLPSSHVWGQVDGAEVAFQDAFANPPGSVFTLYGYPDGPFESKDLGGATAAEVARLQAQVTYRAAVGEGEWTCEWRIPFAACGYTAASAPVLRLNLGALKTEPNAWVIWRGTGGATYHVAGGGLLVFPREAREAGVPTGGLAVWLDAAAPETLTTDDAGKVTLWRDRSGNGRDAEQTDARFCPTLEPEGLSGHPALRFDETALTRLELPDLSDQKLTGTVLAVISNPLPGAEVNHDPRIFTASDGTGYDYQVGIALTVPGMETGGPRVVASGFQDAWARHVHVGCFSPNFQTYFSGHIAEILVYTRALEPAEQDRLRGYLAAKWDVDR